MAPRLSGQTSIFGVVFFVSKSLLGIEGQKKLEKFAIFTRKPRSHARILIYRTWPIARDTNVVVDSIVYITACVAPFILHLPALKLENKSVVLPNLSYRK